MYKICLFLSAIGIFLLIEHSKDMGNDWNKTTPLKEVLQNIGEPATLHFETSNNHFLPSKQTDEQIKTILQP